MMSNAVAVNDLTNRAASKADSAIDSTRAVANDALDTLKAGVEQAREAAPSFLSKAAGKVEAFSRKTYDQACDAGKTAKESAEKANEATRAYIRDEPVKSVLIAAAAGAALAGLVAWLSKPRSSV